MVAAAFPRPSSSMVARVRRRSDVSRFLRDPAAKLFGNDTPAGVSVFIGHRAGDRVELFSSAFSSAWYWGPSPIMPETLARRIGQALKLPASFDRVIVRRLLLRFHPTGFGVNLAHLVELTEQWRAER